MSDTTKCPACSSPDHTSTTTSGVVTCDACQALYSTRPIYLGESYRLVGAFFTNDPAADARAKYFDFQTLGSAGLDRRHGWFDPETRLITQVG